MINDLMLHVRRELGPIAVPSAIELTPTLPKTRSGNDHTPTANGAGAGAEPGGHNDAGGLADPLWQSSVERYTGSIRCVGIRAGAYSTASA